MLFGIYFANFGLLDCWIVGLLDCWIVGLLDCWEMSYRDVIRACRRSSRDINFNI